MTLCKINIVYDLCVCVCVCERERDGKRERVIGEVSKRKRDCTRTFNTEGKLDYTPVYCCSRNRRRNSACFIDTSGYSSCFSSLSRTAKCNSLHVAGCP